MAVYTKVEASEAADFLQSYDLGAFQELIGIPSGVENTNYFLLSTAGRNILTLYEKRTRREDLPFFLSLMDHLAQKGVACPRPVHARDGVALRDLAGRPAAITTCLPGDTIKETPSPSACAQVGEVLASIHVAGADFPMSRPNSMALDAWHVLFGQCAPRADEVQPGLAAAIKEELSFLNPRWPRDLPRGIIHADLFQDNVLFVGDRLGGAIDFYFACTDFPVYDLAITLSAWCFDDHRTLNAARARAMMEAYQAVRPLSRAEKEAFPLLARGAALRFLLSRLYDWLHQVPGALVKPHNPLEYFTRLQFHQGMGCFEDYGFGAAPAARRA